MKDFDALSITLLAFSLSGQPDLLCPSFLQFQHLAFECLHTLKSFLGFPLFEFLVPTFPWFSGHFGESDLCPYSPHLRHVPLNWTLNPAAKAFSLWSFCLAFEIIPSNLEFNFSLMESIVNLSSPVETRWVSILSRKTSYYFWRLFSTWIMNSLSLILPTSPISSILCLNASRFVIQISGSLSAESNLLFAKILHNLRRDGAVYLDQILNGGNPMQAYNFLQESLQSIKYWPANWMQPFQQQSCCQ